MFVRNMMMTVCALALAGGSALAQQQVMHVDTAKSSVQFTLGDPLHSVHGTFRLESGEISFASAGGQMSGAVVVNAASGDSGNSSRDKKMTNDQLKASTFTTVSFKPQHYTGTLNPTGDSNITVDGVFTLLGTPHDISLPVHVHRDGNHLDATGTFIVPYVKWGVKDPSNFLLKVSKEVSIQISLTGTVSAE